MSTKFVIATGFAAALWLSVPGLAQEQYPNRVVEVIVPYPAGGNSDVMGRTFFNALSKNKGIQTIIVNRAGAGGTIGFAQLAAAKPDGHTLAFGPTSALTSAPHLMNKLPYKFEDIAFVCHVFENVFTISVAPNSRFSSLNDLIDAAKSSPGKLAFGSSGMASGPHLTGEGFARELGISVNHIPYRGDAQVVPQVLGGQIEFSITGMGSAVRSLRPLAVFSEARHPQLPDVPTVAELGLPMQPPGFQGIYAPAGTPPAIMTTLERACRETHASDEFQAFGTKVRQRLVYLSGKDFEKRARADYEYKGKLIRELGIKSN